MPGGAWSPEEAAARRPVALVALEPGSAASDATKKKQTKVALSEESGARGAKIGVSFAAALPRTHILRPPPLAGYYAVSFFSS